MASPVRLWSNSYPLPKAGAHDAVLGQQAEPARLPFEGGGAGGGLAESSDSSNPFIFQLFSS